VLHEPRFVDLAPAWVYATLLDEGMYLYSERTMYRILDGHDEVRERSDQLRHPSYAKLELLATAPNQLWSWDITKLLGATAHREYPDRFPHGVPTPAPLSTAVWINKPNPATAMSGDGIVRARCS
jgi:hypothetical protein